MGSQWVDDPSWGNILGDAVTGFQNAPKVALTNIAIAEKIKGERADRARQAEQDALAGQTGEAAVAALPTVAPTTTSIGPMVGDVNNPADVQGVPTAEYTDPRIKAQFDTQRALSAAALRQAAGKGEVDKLYPLIAQGQVAGSGIPGDLAARQRLQFATTGKIEQPKDENYVAIDPNTKQVVRVWSSADGGLTDSMGNDMKRLLPPGVQVAKGGAAEANPAPINPFKDEGTRGQFLAAAANALPTKPPTNVRDLAQALEMQYPTINKTMSDAVGNTILLKNFMEKNVPPSLRPLAEHVANTMYPGSVTPAAPGAPAVGAQPSAALAPGTPQMSTEVISAAPSSHEQQNITQAVGRASAEADSLMAQMGAVNGVLPDKFYVPTKAAALMNEKGTILGSDLLGTAATGALDAKSQKFFQTAKAFVEPVLRVASGAAIRPEEYRDYEKMFIPTAFDSREAAQAKVTRMAQWSLIVSHAANADQALGMMANVAKGDPALSSTIVKLRERATQAGTLNTPNPDYKPPGAATPAATPAPATAGLATGAPTTAAPAGIPPIADRVVGQKYPSPNGPVTWTKEGWVR